MAMEQMEQLNQPDQASSVTARPADSRRHALSSSAIPRSRSDDSWIEVSSRPSSSSLSSANEEIITTGLRVQQSLNQRRRRRLRRVSTEDPPRSMPATSTGGGSSQDEYDDSESESDRPMNSSGEEPSQSSSPLREEWGPGAAGFSSASSENAYQSEGDVEYDDGDDDDDENATAIGPIRSGASFRPRPNAFSHPPTATADRQQTNSLPYYGTAHRTQRGSTQRHSSYPSHSQHSPYNVISPSYQADHDAALRASLSTLLSCAAAARGLSKQGMDAVRVQNKPATTSRIDPTSLRMMPASEFFGAPVSPTNLCQNPESTAAMEATEETWTAEQADKGKRKATATSSQPRSSSKERRAAKKARRSATPYAPVNMEDISPTLLTWVVSAGVVVLVSAIGFSAGYVVGKEAGRIEATGLSVANCGRDLSSENATSALGWRRWRWTGSATGVSA